MLYYVIYYSSIVCSLCLPTLDTLQHIILIIVYCMIKRSLLGTATAVPNTEFESLTVQGSFMIVKGDILNSRGTGTFRSCICRFLISSRRHPERGFGARPDSGTFCSLVEQRKSSERAPRSRRAKISQGPLPKVVKQNMYNRKLWKAHAHIKQTILIQQIIIPGSPAVLRLVLEASDREYGPGTSSEDR